MPINAHFFRRVILTRKVGYTGLVFDMQSQFISRSVSLCTQDYLILYSMKPKSKQFCCEKI